MRYRITEIKRKDQSTARLWLMVVLGIDPGTLVASGMKDFA